MHSHLHGAEILDYHRGPGTNMVKIRFNDHSVGWIPLITVAHYLFQEVKYA